MSGLYVHIPFCRAKCAYCDFFSRPRADKELIGRYVDRLIGEYGERRGETGEAFTTVYIGGGTPSVVSPGHLDHLFAALPSGEEITEYTLEANPEHVTSDFLKWLRDTPVNRLSIGVQSFNDEELDFIGRGHDGATALKALELIASDGPANFTADLIYGLPYQTIESWERNLDRMLEFAPPHLSAYMLSWEEGTRLNAMRLVGKVKPSDEDLLVDMYGILCDRLAQSGYEHYEISNFAREGRRSVHNTNYWLDRPYLGIGASAHSFTGSIRRVNPLSIPDYMRGAGAKVEEENENERHNDRLLTALRTAEGISLTDFGKRFGAETAARIERLSLPYQRKGDMVVRGDRLAMTERGWLLTDSVLVDLFV